MPVSPNLLTRRERKIMERAQALEIEPLLELLAGEGYERDDITFESNPEQASSGAVVEAVRFERVPFRRAIVTMNVGLLGANGLLPSYFLQIADQSQNADDFFDFIRFFDDRMIGELVRAIRPEVDAALWPDWDRAKSFFLGMLGVGSIATLDWLFRLYFPELGVRARRRSFKNRTQAHALRTGYSRLDGSSVLGKVYESDGAGFEVELIAEEDLDPRGIPWARIVHLRLASTVFPRLAPHRIPLAVVLTILTHSGFAKIEESAYLGYERVKQPPGAPESSLSIMLFEGEARVEELSRPVP